MVLMGMIGSLQAAEAPEAATAASKRLIKAIEEDDFNEFIKNGEPTFQELDKKIFKVVCKKFDERMKGGYDVEFLGDLKQQGYEVTLWRLRFKDGSDDALATLSMKGDKVGGYWIK